MSPSYVQFLMVVLLLSLYSIQQVSSVRCYACHSDTHPECISAAAQSKFAVQCSSYASYANTNSSVFTAFNKPDNTGRQVTQYDCASARGISTKDGRTIVVRGCAIKPVTCDTYKIVYAVGDAKGNGIQVETCNRCSSDFCNYF